MLEKTRGWEGAARERKGSLDGVALSFPSPCSCMNLSKTFKKKGSRRENVPFNQGEDEES